MFIDGVHRVLLWTKLKNQVVQFIIRRCSNDLHPCGTLKDAQIKFKISWQTCMRWWNPEKNTSSVPENLSPISFFILTKNLSPFTFTIFASGPYIPLTHSHSNFILKLIYKSRTHIPLIFSTHFLLHFLKLMSG